jgi:hypothetical protein
VIEATRRQFVQANMRLTNEQSLARWKAVRETMQKLLGFCFLCSKNGADEYGHNVFRCPNKDFPFEIRAYNAWLREARAVYFRGTRLRSCMSCGMPEIDYHKYLRPRGTIYNCDNQDNTLPLIYLLLHAPRYREVISKEFPEAFEPSVATWLFSDVEERGDTGMVRLLEWFFNNIYSN